MCNNLRIFFYYLIRNAQDILTIKKVLPNLIVFVSCRNCHNKTICVKNHSHIYFR